MELENKKILQVGLGILGGGVATAKFLVGQGAILTITDLKDENYLSDSIEKLSEFKNKIRFVFGNHNEIDFLDNDIIVINPDVSIYNKYIEIARKAGKQIENELSLFYKFCPSKKIVAVTGTRGKTTTVNWIAHLLKSKNSNTLILGNTPERPLLQEINSCNKDSQIVIEAPSFLLEICDTSEFAPHVAVITNIYRDHINRHESMEEYARVKGNIFKYQNKDDFLILNKENEWTKLFLAQNPKAKVAYFPDDSFLENKNEFIKHWGEHNLQNFEAACLAALIFGVSREDMKKQIVDLPQVKFRQEKIFDDGKLQIYNDTTATSPEALMASMQRFLSSEEKIFFIIGGTDRELDFKNWGEMTKKLLKPENLIFLSGSATEKMKKELGWDNFNEFDTLEECFNNALLMAKSKTKSKIIFSPGAKSFEKFKNEFDRGEKFNALLKK